MGKKPSPAMIIARDRNWKIFRLRGMKALARILLSSDRAAKVMSILDDELENVGATAEPEA